MTFENSADLSDRRVDGAEGRNDRSTTYLVLAVAAVPSLSVHYLREEQASSW